MLRNWSWVTEGIAATWFVALSVMFFLTQTPAVFSSLADHVPAALMQAREAILPFFTAETVLRAP
jgi:hypothetical protein